MGVEFFRRSVELANQYLRPGQRASYTIQTNGTLIDEEWAAFFKDHGVLVGISIDGPQALHDAYRVNKGGKGSFTDVMRGLDHLRERRGRLERPDDRACRQRRSRPRALPLPARRMPGALHPVHPDHRAAARPRAGRRARDVMARSAPVPAGRLAGHTPLGQRRAVRPLPDRRLRGVGATRRRRGLRPDVRRRARELGRRAAWTVRALRDVRARTRARAHRRSLFRAITSSSRVIASATSRSRTCSRSSPRSSRCSSASTSGTRCRSTASTATSVSRATEAAPRIASFRRRPATPA